MITCLYLHIIRIMFLSPLLLSFFFIQIFAGFFPSVLCFPSRDIRLLLYTSRPILCGRHVKAKFAAHTTSQITPAQEDPGIFVSLYERRKKIRRIFVCKQREATTTMYVSDAGGETLTREEFDPNNPEHYEQLTVAEAKVLLANRNQPRWHRVVF
jgi:hypothetical protein